MPRNLLLRAAAAVLACTIGAASAQAEVKLGILANRGEVQALSAWSEFASYLGRAVGDEVKLVPLPIDRIVPAVSSNEVHFMITNPVLSAAAVKRHGATPLATINQGEGVRFGGVIIANAKAGITKGDQLKGRKVMCYNPGSAGAYTFQRYHLFKQGLDITKDFAVLQESKKQDDIVLAVRAGMMDAGFVRTGLLESMAAAGKVKMEDLVIVDKVNDASFPHVRSTALYPEWFLLASPQTDPQIAAKVTAAAMALSGDAPAATSASIKGFEKPVELDGMATLLAELRMAPFDK